MTHVCLSLSLSLYIYIYIYLYICVWQLIMKLSPLTTFTLACFAKVLTLLPISQWKVSSASSCRFLIKMFQLSVLVLFIQLLDPLSLFVSEISLFDWFNKRRLQQILLYESLRTSFPSYHSLVRNTQNWHTDYTCSGEKILWICCIIFVTVDTGNFNFLIPPFFILCKKKLSM